MTLEQTRRAALTMLEYCRLTETDHDGRGVRWRLMCAGREIEEDVAWYSPETYRIDVRKPETVWRVEYALREFPLIASEFRDAQAAEVSLSYGQRGTVTEIERPGEWVTWEPTEPDHIMPCGHHSSS